MKSLTFTMKLKKIEILHKKDLKNKIKKKSTTMWMHYILGFEPDCLKIKPIFKLILSYFNLRFGELRLNLIIMLRYQNHQRLLVQNMQ